MVWAKWKWNKDNKCESIWHQACDINCAQILLSSSKNSFSECNDTLCPWSSFYISYPFSIHVSRRQYNIEERTCFWESQNTNSGSSTMGCVTLYKLLDLSKSQRYFLIWSIQPSSSTVKPWLFCTSPLLKF